MKSLIQFEGKVLGVSDEVRAFPEKDKNGVSTGKMKDHRLTKIQLLVTLADKSMAAVNVNGFDLPSTFSLPKSGDNFTAPITKYDQSKGFPEAWM